MISSYYPYAVGKHCTFEFCDQSMMLFGYVSGEARLLSSGSEYKLVRTFDVIKAVSATVFDMINAIYGDKPLIFIGTRFQEKFVSLHQAVNINCLSLSRLFLTQY